MSGRLTTHVLDTAQGRPAAHMQVELWYLGAHGENEERRLVKTTHTNADGRTDEPLLADGALVLGIYELIFNVEAYFATQALDLPTPPFLTRVPLRFGVADAAAHYHVPLLTSPWAYSTYRGS